MKLEPCGRVSCGQIIECLTTERDELLGNIATLDQESRQMRARMERLEAENAELKELVK